MKRIKKYVTMALAGIMLFALTGCNMIERTEESKGKTVLAKVGDTKITRSDVDERLTAYLDQYREQYGDDFESNSSLTEALKTLRTRQLEALVDEEVLMQSKEEFGVNPTDEEVQTQVDERINYYKEMLGSDEQYVSFIESYGYTEESFIEYLKKQVVLGMVVDAMVADVEVTDEEIETYYNENIDNYKTKAGAHVTHLLFQPEKDDNGNVVEGGDEAALALAENARQLALSGKSLKEISESSEFADKSKYEDLDYVTFENSGMVQEFEDAFKVLPVNQVSEIVKTSYGYHIIVNTEVKSEDEVQPLDETLKETIKSTLLTKKQEEQYETKLEDAKKNLKVKTYENKL